MKHLIPILLGISSPALADAVLDNQLRGNTMAFELGGYADAAVALEHGGAAELHDNRTIADCQRQLATEYKGWLVDDRFEHFATVESRDDHFYLASENAHVVCDRFTIAHHLAEAEAALEPALYRLRFLASLDPSTDWIGAGPKMVAEAKACAAAMDRLGPGTIPNVKLTTAEARVKICDELAKRGETWDKQGDAKRVATHARIVKPLAAVGIAGDKLALLVDHDGYAHYGVGGDELVSPGALARASVLFEVTSNDVSWTVRRYQFSGNRLAGTSTETYLKRPGSRAFH